jgi:hypothetical protein
MAEDLVEAHRVIESLVADIADDNSIVRRTIEEGQAREEFLRETSGINLPGADEDERNAAAIAEILSEDRRVRPLHIRDFDTPLTTT